MSPFPACLWSQGDGCGEGRSLGPHVHSLTYLCKSLTEVRDLHSALILCGTFFFFMAFIALCYRALGSWNIPCRSILYPGTSQDSYTMQFFLNSWVFLLLLFWFSPMPFGWGGIEWAALWALAAVWCWTMTDRAALLPSPGSQCLPLPWDRAEGEVQGRLPAGA